MLSYILFLLFPLMLSVSYVNCAEGSACSGNIQDVPITNFKNTPLKGWSAFAVSPINSLLGVNQTKLYEKVVALAKSELAKTGKITEMEPPDVTGLGMAANILNLEVQEVKTGEAKIAHLIRISLTLQTTTTINKTHQECAAYVWASSIFVEGSVVEANEKNILGGVEKLFKQFTTCYHASNADRADKPIFYWYK